MTDNRLRVEGFFAQPANIDVHDMELEIVSPLARSGESLIFAGIHRSLGEVAVKIGCQTLVETCSEIARHHDIMDATTIELTEERLRTPRQIQQERTAERTRALGRHFSTMLVPEYSMLQPVSLPGTLLDYSLRSQIYKRTRTPDIDPEKSYLLETVVRVQRFIPALFDNNRVSLSTRYAEMMWDNEGYVSEEDYIRATSDLVFNEGLSTRHKYSLEELLQIQGSPYLAKLATQARDNSQLAQSLCVFLDNLAAYTDETNGALVDIIGKDNVLYLGTKGIMTDGLYAEDTTPMAGAAVAFEDLAGNKTPQKEKMNQCFNTLNFIRGMNIVAIACSSGIRFSLDTPQGVETKDLLKEVVDLSRQQYGLRGNSRIMQ